MHLLQNVLLAMEVSCYGILQYSTVLYNSARVERVGKGKV